MTSATTQQIVAAVCHAYCNSSPSSHTVQSTQVPQLVKLKNKQIPIKKDIRDQSFHPLWTDVIGETASNATLIAAGGGGIQSTANTTQYWAVHGQHDPRTTEAEAEIPIQVAGTIRYFSLLIEISNCVGDSTFTIRKNGVDTALKVSVPSSGNGFYEDLNNSFTVAAGDKICLKSVHGDATGTFKINAIDLVFIPDDSTQSVQLCCGGNASQNLTTANITKYHRLSGNNNVVGAEADAKTRQRVTGSYKYFFVYVSANARTTNTTFKSRKNGADGNLTVTFASGETGLKQDLVHVDDVVSGDDYNFASVTGSGTETLTWLIIGVHFVNSQYSGFLETSGANNRTANGSGHYVASGGTSTSGNENQRYRKIRIFKLIFKDLFTLINNNTITADSTYKLKKNGSDTALSATVTASTNGQFGDTTDAIDVNTNDNLSFKYATGATGTSFDNFNIIAYYRTGNSVAWSASLSESSISSTDSIARLLEESRTLSESSISDTDSLDRVYGSNRSLSEASISSTDNIARTIGYPRDINESSISSGDTLTKSQILARALSEAAITVSDQVDRLIALFRTPSDTVTSGDSVARTIGYPRSINESSISVSDQLDRRLDFFRSLVESAISSTDSAVRAVVNSRTLSEVSITVSDLLSRVYNAFRTNPESVTSGDQLDRSVVNSRAINEPSISSTDSAARTYNANRSINESSISTGDTLTKSQILSRTLTETAITVSDQLNRMVEFFRTLPQSVTSGDSIVRAVTNIRELIESSISSSDLVNRIYNAFRNPNDSVSVDDSVAADVTSQGNFNRDLNESVSAGDSIDRSVTNSRSLPESVSSGDSVDRVVGFFRTLSDTVGITDAVNKSLVFARSMSDTIVSTDTVQRVLAIFRTNPESVSSGDSVSRSVDNTRPLSDNTAVSDNMARSVNNSRPLSDSISSGDNVSRITSFVRSLVDSSGVLDVVSRAVTNLRTIVESIPVVDLLTDLIKRHEDVTSTDIPLLITHWLENNWTDDPLSTVEHYLIPPKSKITFGSRFDMAAGTHSDMHIHVRNVNKNVTALSTDATVQENSALVSIWVEVRYIPDSPPDFSGTNAGAPSDMMWQIRSYIDELIRSDPQQLLDDFGIEVISIMQEIPDANTPADVHAQNVIEDMYTIIILVKCFYTLDVDRQA